MPSSTPSSDVCYENYPVRIILISNLLNLAIIGIGTYILARLWFVWALAFLGYCLWLEFRLLRFHCIHCYYYGKRCGFGKGWVAAKLFKKGDPDRFTSRECNWTDMIPDMMVFLFPLAGGIVGLIREFSWFLVLCLAVLLVLVTAGNGYVRGSLVCRSCKQRELGCPAEQMFGKTRPESGSERPAF